jgi:spermidine synthase
MTKLGELDFYAAMIRTLQAVFPHVGPYQSFIPCFGTPWGFAVAGKRDDAAALAPAAVDRRLAERGVGPMRFYDGLAHQHMLSLPLFLRKVVADCPRIITDAEPLIVS